MTRTIPLAAMLAAADQKPGRNAFARFDELRAALDRQLAEVRRVLGEERAGT